MNSLSKSLLLYILLIFLLQQRRSYFLFFGAIRQNWMLTSKLISFSLAYSNNSKSLLLYILLIFLLQQRRSYFLFFEAIRQNWTLTGHIFYSLEQYVKIGCLQQFRDVYYISYFLRCKRRAIR